jgi:hypothetical protein
MSPAAPALDSPSAKIQECKKKSKLIQVKAIYLRGSYTCSLISNSAYFTSISTTDVQKT